MVKYFFNDKWFDSLKAAKAEANLALRHDEVGLIYTAVKRRNCPMYAYCRRRVYPAGCELVSRKLENGFWLLNKAGFFD